MKNKTAKAWVLESKDGRFIAALRFKPTRVYQGKKGDGGHYAWTDCNGAKPHPNLKGYAGNTIEGTMNARCREVTLRY